MASSKAFLLCLGLLLTLFISQAYTHGLDEYECNHDSVEHNPEFIDVEEDTSAFNNQDGRVLASTSYSNIRIYPYYEYVKQTAPSSYASYMINDLVPPVIDFFQAALKIKAPLTSNLKITSSSICERSTPSVLKTGVAADMFVYFDTEAISGTQIAVSKYCQLASGTKRPIVARVKVNRNMMRDPNGDVLLHEQNMYVMLHEMVHNFGFSTYNFKTFLDENGRTRTGHIKSVSIAGSTRTVLDLPPLTERLRRHFGCSTLQGAIMENSGGSTTAASHFERKYFIYEMMSSGSILGRRITEFSLALLEGSGWFVPDYSYAEPYHFGAGQGCSFITSTCSSTTSKFDEFCTGSSKGCAPHGRGGGYCQSDSISDSCRYYYPNKDYDCENDDGEDDARLPSLEVYGREAGSKCFTGTLNTRQSSNGRTSYCFKYTCTGSGSSTQLEVQIGTNKITCTSEGSKSLNGYYGSFDCPDPLTFCNGAGKKYCPRNCMGRGTCVDNKCQCKSGYKGVDCALRA